MKLILVKEVLGLGDPGEIINVKDGYGRNYLVPKGIAIIATKKNMTAILAEQRRITAVQIREAKQIKDEAEEVRQIKLIILARAGEGGKLYGSVTNIDIAKAFSKVGYNIDRRRIILEDPIKRLGIYPIKIKLHSKVIVDVNLSVELLTIDTEEE